MNDLTLDTVNRPHAAGLIRQGTPLRSQAWLSQFERARWEAQPRYQGAADMPATQISNEKASPTEADRFGMRRRYDQLDETPSLSRKAELIPPALDRFEASDIQFANKKEILASEIETPAVVGAAVRKSSSIDRSTPQTERASTPTQSFDTQWFSRSIHAHVGEQATTVWIRDAGLSPQQAVRLLERLRPLLGGDQATGTGFIQLTVNGRAVIPGGQR